MIKNKFLFILPTDAVGGAERVAKNYISYLLSFGENEVDVFFMSKGNRGFWADISHFDNATFYYVDSNSELNGVFKLIFLLIQKGKNYYLTYSTHTHVNAFVSFMRILNIIKTKYHIARESTVIFDRFFGIKRLIMKILYMFYRNINLLIFQTEYMKEQLLKEMPRLEKYNNQVLKNPLNLAVIKNHLDNGTPIDKDCLFKILYVGRLVEIKNVFLILNSLAAIELKIENFCFFIVGDGEQRPLLEDTANHLGISDKVKFVGNVMDPYSFMNTADLGILSSISEGFPNVLLEMMASGTKNIITTPCTPSVKDLPNVSVLNGFSVAELSDVILHSIKAKKDYSSSYIDFSKSLDVSNFHKKIISAISS